MTPDQRNAVLLALLDDPDHQVMYRQSASFHHGIDQLVAMLPAFVQGLALQATAADHELEARALAMRLRPLGSVGPWPAAVDDIPPDNHQET